MTKYIKRRDITFTLSQKVVINVGNLGTDKPSKAELSIKKYKLKMKTESNSSCTKNPSTSLQQSFPLRLTAAEKDCGAVFTVQCPVFSTPA